jgi:hypothetical protein
MTPTRHSAPNVQFSYLQADRGSAPPSSVDAVASNYKSLLQTVWWISRTWVERVAVHDPHRVSLIDLGLLVDDLVRAGDYSSAAMMDVQSHLCDGCRRLNAASGQCTGQSLHECPLLREASH